MGSGRTLHLCRNWSSDLKLCPVPTLLGALGVSPTQAGEGGTETRGGPLEPVVDPRPDALHLSLALPDLKVPTTSRTGVKVSPSPWGTGLSLRHLSLDILHG